MKYPILFALFSSIGLFITACSEKAVSANSNGNITIQSLAATPTSVLAGETSLITCKVTGTNLKYKWDATGAYGFLTPMDSVCVFSSPSCHSGPATVTVTVSDGNGATATESVNLN